MMDSEVKVTPTFKLYRGNDCVLTLAGTNEKKLRSAIAQHLMPLEAGFGMQMTVDEDDLPAPATATPASVPTPQARQADSPPRESQPQQQQQKQSSAAEAVSSLISSITPRLVDTAIKVAQDITGSKDVVS